MKWAIALLLCVGLRAGEWTVKEYAIEALSVAPIIVDWGQTLDIERDNRYAETNRIMGRHPTRKTVNLYFSALVLSHITIAKLLPEAWRRAFQVVSVCVVLSTVNHNRTLGIRTNF